MAAEIVEKMWKERKWFGINDDLVGRRPKGGLSGGSSTTFHYHDLNPCPPQAPFQDIHVMPIGHPVGSVEVVLVASGGEHFSFASVHYPSPG